MVETDLGDTLSLAIHLGHDVIPPESSRLFGTDAGHEAVLEAPRTSAVKGANPGTSMERIIFDPKTGALPATMETTVTPGGYLPGTLEGYDVRISAAWSDTRPARPPRA